MLSTKGFKSLIAGTMLLFGALEASAQFPDDALRYGYPVPHGTARSQAIGGAMGSLGGDISAAHVNPAGIGLFKNNEIVLTPQYNMLTNKFDYQGTNTTSQQTGFRLGTSGFVFGKAKNNPYSKTVSSAVAVTYNRLADYNDNIKYQGFNNSSSWTEQYLEELFANNVRDFGALENDFPYGSSLAFWTFLIDTVSGPNGTIDGYQSTTPLNPGGGNDIGINQFNDVITQGGSNEIAISYGANRQDKFYWGISFGVPFMNYSRQQTYREEDASNDPDNDFSYFQYDETYNSKGIGFNAKAGIIARAGNNVRVGLAIHSPTFSSFTDNMRSSIEANTENFTDRPQPVRMTSDELNNANGWTNEYRYTLSTPARFIGSLSYVLNSVQDVKQQRGFVTADLEYVTNRGVRYTANDPTNSGDVSYYNDLNDIIRERFKNTINARLGGELKFTNIMARAGFAYYGSPYASSEIDGTRMLLSGGLGYREHGFAIDLAYVHGIMKSSNVPYYLADKPNVIADGRNTKGMVVLTLGYKFL